MGIIDRIKYDGDSNGSQWLVHKCPSEQFVLGTRLIVNQGQEVLFFKGGKPLDLFGPGTHTLSPGNLPFLNKIVNLPFGGNTSFIAEVYYINKTVNLNLKWGTSTPIPLEDPKYGLILNIGARGQYGITIRDSRRFVSSVIGAIPNGTTLTPLFVLRYLNGVVNSNIKSVTASYMIKKRISFLEISQYLSELSDRFRRTLNIEFCRYGIELAYFNCEAIAPKSDEYEKLRQYKEELALGADFYQKRRSFDVLEKMAENMYGGSIADASVALNKSFGLNGQFESNYSGNERNENAKHSEKQVVCIKCGAKNNSVMKFCGECGKPVEIQNNSFDEFKNKEDITNSFVIKHRYLKLRE